MVFGETATCSTASDLSTTSKSCFIGVLLKKSPRENVPLSALVRSMVCHSKWEEL